MGGTWFIFEKELNGLERFRAISKACIRNSPKRFRAVSKIPYVYSL